MTENMDRKILKGVCTYCSGLGWHEQEEKEIVKSSIELLRSTLSFFLFIIIQ